MTDPDREFGREIEHRRRALGLSTSVAAGVTPRTLPLARASWATNDRIGVEAATRHFGTGPITHGLLLTLLPAVSRNCMPRVLLEAWRTGRLHVDVLAMYLPFAWGLWDYPHDILSREEWLEMFGATGFTVNGKRCPRPDHSVRLYRYSAPQYQRNWAWTDDLDVAASFKGRRGIFPGSTRFGLDRLPGLFWTTFAPPAALLACIMWNGTEYVTNTEGLVIQRYQPDDVRRARIE